MAKFLFTAWPYPGSLNPQIAVAHALKSRGHTVGFYSGTRAANLIHGEGFTFFPLGKSLDQRIEGMLDSPKGIGRGWQEIWGIPTILRTWLLETIPDQIVDLDRILEKWGPDAIICEPPMWGPIVILYEARQIPVALLEYAACMLPGPDVSPPGLGLPPPRTWSLRLQGRLGNSMLELLARGLRRSTNKLRRQYGLPPLESTVVALTEKLSLVLVPSCPEFDYMRGDLPQNVKYVGPCLWYPSTWKESDWLNELSSDRPLVHVTEGTLYAQAPVVLRAAAQGLADLPVQVIITTGTHRKESMVKLGRLPSNVIVKSMVAHSKLMPHLDLLISHGGGGTTVASLASGVPMVVVPLMWDQAENAQRVCEAGAGVQFSARQCSPRRMRKAVEIVLSDASYRKNGQRIADSLGQYGGPSQAAELLEQMLSS